MDSAGSGKVLLSALWDEQLVEMHDRLSKSVQASYADGDANSLGILQSLERKIVTVLYERLQQLLSSLTIERSNPSEPERPCLEATEGTKRPVERSRCG